MKSVWVCFVGVAIGAIVLSAGPGRAGDPSDVLAERLKSMSPQEQLSLLRTKAGDAKVDFYMGNAFYALAEYDSAVAHYQSAVERDSTYAKAYVNMGIALDTAGRYQRARAAYERALEINPEDVLACCHLGYNYYTLGDADRAMELYQRALEIDPNSAQAHYNLGLAFANAKIFEEALVEWRKVIEVDPDGDLGRIAAENVELIRTYMELGK